MITNIQGQTINEVVLNSIKQLKEDGVKTPSRNGDIHAIYNALLTLKNPKSRHLNLLGRKNNIFATIAETFWVYSGSVDVTGFLEFFLPRAKDFADDGVNWHGGYGKRIYIYNQLDDVIQQFRNEGLYTRRANLYIGQPEFDTYQQLDAHLAKDTTFDRSCNQLFNFFVTPDKKLNINGFSRSGDIIWGIGSINLFEFSYLQEFILQQLKMELEEPELQLGEYNHWVTNLHLYDFNGQQGLDALERYDEQDLTSQNYQELKFPLGVNSFKMFHRKLLETYMVFIGAEEVPTPEQIMEQIKKVFFEFYVPTKDNLLYVYAELVANFICTKKAGLKGDDRADFVYDVSSLDNEVKSCIKNSVFRKFNIKE